MFDHLIKAVVGVVVDLPISIVQDVVTLGGSLTDEEPVTLKALAGIVKNIDEAVNPD